MVNKTQAENFILSMNAPHARATVIAANVIWKTINMYSGIVPVKLSTPIPERNIFYGFPIIPPISGPNAKVYP